jgi:lipopolysaccharide/colanic/teichoic acid biosynthesis glycosyltransferase
VFGSGSQLTQVAELPLLANRTIGPARSTLFLKRVFDLLVGTLALLVLLPVFAVVALAIRFDTRGPALFRQQRIGRGARPFTMLKFRTMVAGASDQRAGVAHLNRHAAVDPRMFKAVNDPRVTRVGRVLRRMSFDELPQLINVVRGEMSLVGPRPLVPEEDVFVTGWARARSDVLPGITGAWQVNGASDLTFSEMIELDYDYVASLSLRRDLQLIFRTLPALVGRRSG